MLTRLFPIVVLVLGAALVAPASALVIDDFSAGGTSLTLADSEINKWSLEAGLASPAVYKGRRYVQLDWEPTSPGGAGDSASVAVNSGGSGVATLTKVGDPRVWYGYGKYAFDFTWDEDFSSSATSQLKVTFAAPGAPDTVEISFFITGLIGGVEKVINDHIMFSPGQTEGFFDLVGTANAQGIDADLLRQHVTGLAVYYVGDYNTDTARTISLDSIELVPEPGTMGLLAIGGVGALIRRRRRN
jgi:hypothetical protein